MCCGERSSSATATARTPLPSITSSTPEFGGDVWGRKTADCVVLSEHRAKFGRSPMAYSDACRVVGQVHR